MKNYWIPAGIILNSVVIVIDRFFVSMPDLIYFPCMIAGIVLMLVGLVKAR